MAKEKLAYSVKSAAEMLDCSPRHINYLIAANLLPAFTMGPNTEGGASGRGKRWIRHADLMSYLDDCADNQAA